MVMIKRVAFVILLHNVRRSKFRTCGIKICRVKKFLHIFARMHLRIDISAVRCRALKHMLKNSIPSTMANFATLVL